MFDLTGRIARLPHGFLVHCRIMDTNNKQEDSVNDSVLCSIDSESDGDAAYETTALFGEDHKQHLLSQSTTTTPTQRDHEKLRKRLTFAAFAVTYFTMTASYSVIAPFYPTEVKY